MSLHNKYVQYDEDCLTKFKMDMWQRLIDAVNIPEWKEEIDKIGFSRLLDNKVHDALWNAKDILSKYGKEHCVGDEAFEQVILKAKLFVGRCAPFAKNKNRRGSVDWWKSADGIAELGRGRQHLIALPDIAQVIHQDNEEMKSGYATIRRVRIEGCPGILNPWEFAAKLSNQHRTRPKLAKMEH